MDVWQTPQDAALYAAKRTADKRAHGFIDRLASMLTHVSKADMPILPGCTVPLMARVKVERVAADWPLSGAIYARNKETGRRYRLWLDRGNLGGWKVDIA